MLNRPGKRVASSRDRAERPATRHRLEDVTVHLAILPQRRNMGRGPTSRRRGGQRHTKQRRLPVAPSGLPIGPGHRRVPAPHILADDQLGPQVDHHLVARLEQPGAAQGQEPVPEDRLRLAWTIREADPVGLRSAVKQVFRDRALVHRCQWHKRENVVSYLPKSEQGDWRRRASTSNRASARW